MKDNRLTLGPRSWAVLTLAGGSALALPFLRAPRTDSPRPAELAITQQQLPADIPAPSQALHAANNLPTIAGNLPSTAPDNPATQPQIFRAVIGEFPTTQRIGATITRGPTPSRVSLPEWARPESKIDEVIAMGIANSPPPTEIRSGDNDGSFRMKPWTEAPSGDRPQRALSAAAEMASDAIASNNATPFSAPPTFKLSPAENLVVPPPLASPAPGALRNRLAQPAASLGVIRNVAAQKPLPEPGLGEPKPPVLTQPPAETRNFVFQPGLKPQ